MSRRQGKGAIRASRFARQRSIRFLKSQVFETTRRTELNPKRTLALCSVLALVLWGLAIGTGFAGKPGLTAVTVSIRSTADLPLGPYDVVHGDGNGHAATIDTNGPSLYYNWSSGQVSYDLGSDNVYFGDPNCPSGQFTGTLNGLGNLRVTLDAGTWLSMGVGTSQTGLATYNIGGGAYLLRFRAIDPLDVRPAGTPNCSTQATITRTASGTWTVETDSQDIARLVVPTSHGPGFTNLGHYKPAVFRLTVTNP